MFPRMFLLIAFAFFVAPVRSETPVEQFEKRVRPLLLSKCVACHSAEKAKGRLRLDSAEGVALGGESGSAVAPGKPDESLLIQAVRQTGELKMPPKGKLADSEIADLAAWIKAGAVWPQPLGAAKATTPASTAVRSMEPDDPTLRPYLQAWYRADRLPIADGKSVHVWPDSSGKGRDLAATAGIRAGGVGAPPTFAAQSGVYRRPAVRFDVHSGLATSPDLPVEIRGDAALTMLVVMRLQKHDAQPPFDGVLGVGDPAADGDPGRPLAALIQIQRTQGAELQFAGGWNHNATLGPGSFEPLWDRPVLLTIVKSPGRIGRTTRFFIDGVPSDDPTIGRAPNGRDGFPDIRHRSDIGLYIGKALAWCGAIRGDVAEAMVYNRALAETDRTAVEVHLAQKYGLIHRAVLAQSKATFTPAQKHYWAFQPLRATTPPAGSSAEETKTPIDRFLAASLEKSKIIPAAPAAKRTLLRRATYDLIGLPPTPEEVDAFLKDASPDAFAAVVDRLLQSPHYGERWARHWLDVVRYAETTANDANAVMRYACRYRDYVVDAFNQDKPYDQFVIEQIAGDLLPATGNLSRDAAQVIATGFLMIGAKALAETDKEQSRLDVIDDQIDVTGRTFLGLTLGCARCHDHKFDPIPAVDYYSLAGIFRGTEVFRDEVRNATMFQEWPLLQLPGEPPVMVMAPKEGAPVNLRVHLRGNRHTLGVVAPRRFLQIIAGEGSPPMTTGQSGRLELARWIASKDNPLTARVMVNRVWQHHFGTGLVATTDNLGARGEAPSHPELLDWLAADFISTGWSLKSLHRRILLTAAYQRSARPADRALRIDPNNRLLWRMPHRRLDAESIRDAMLAVSGRLDRRVGGNDSGEFLFREGEVIDAKRDFFRPNRVRADNAYYTTSTRRSLYLPVVRNAVPDVFTLFDSADPNGVTAVRNETTVASQALFLLNHPFVREQAGALAERLLDDVKASDADRIRLGYRLALARDARPDEQHKTADYLQRFAQRTAVAGSKPDEARRSAWRSFAQSLLCRNEFLYVD